MSNTYIKILFKDEARIIDCIKLVEALKNDLNAEALFPVAEISIESDIPDPFVKKIINSFVKKIIN